MDEREAGDTDFNSTTKDKNLVPPSGSTHYLFNSLAKKKKNPNLMIKLLDTCKLLFRKYRKEHGGGTPENPFSGKLIRTNDFSYTHIDMHASKGGGT